MQIGMPGRIAKYTFVIYKTGQLYSSTLQNQAIGPARTQTIRENIGPSNVVPTLGEGLLTLQQFLCNKQALKNTDHKKMEA